MTTHQNIENIFNQTFDPISQKINKLSSNTLTNIKENFKLIYEIEILGFNHIVLQMDYDLLNSLHRSEIIEIRNIFENLYDICIKLHEHSLYPYIDEFKLRKDLEPLTNPNLSKLKELINRINKIIISKSIEHKNREW